MKLKMGLVVAAVFGLMVPVAIQAQPAQNETSDKSASVRSITGCLSNGDKAGEYKLVTSEGNTWEVQSKTVKLSPHVGHTVTVTGKVWHADMHGAKEKTKQAVDANANEHGHLAATEVSMVSESCKQ